MFLLASILLTTPIGLHPSSAASHRLLQESQIENRGQAIVNGALVDYDWRFRIAAPQEGWSLLMEPEVQEIFPGDAAGVRAISGESDQDYYGVRVIRTGEEEFDPAALERRLRFGDLVVDLMGQHIGAKTVLSRFVETGGSRRDHEYWVVIDGGLAGDKVRHQFLIGEFAEYELRDYKYVLTSRSQLGGQPVPEAPPQFFESITFLPEGILPRLLPQATREVRGRGYESFEGVLTSACFPIRIRTGDGWRAMSGDHLWGEYLDSELGIEHEERIVRITVQASWIPHSLAVELVELGLEWIDDPDDPDTPYDPFSVSLAGEERQMLRYLEDEGIQHWYTSFAVDDLLVEITAKAIGDAPDITQLVVEGVKRIELSSTEDFEADRTRLLATADPEARIETDSALHSGVFTHYPYGLTFRKPENAIWRSAIRNEGWLVTAEWNYTEESILFLKEPGAKLHCSLEVQVLDGVRDKTQALDELHLFGVERVSDYLQSGPDTPKVEATTIAGMDSRRTVLRRNGEFHNGQAGILETVVWQDKVLWMTVIGNARDVLGAPKVIESLRAGLEFERVPVSPVAITPTSYMNRRLGFLLNFEEQAVKFKESHEVDGDARVDVEVLGQDFSVGARYGRADKSMELFALSLLWSATRSMSLDRALADAKPERTSLAGLPAVRVGSQGGAEAVEVWVAERDRIRYFFIAKGTQEHIDKMIGTFDLVDPLGGRLRR